MLCIPSLVLIYLITGSLEYHLSVCIQFPLPSPTLLSFFKIFIYLFLAALGLRCWSQAFSSCSKRGLLFLAVRGLLIVVFCLAAEQGL